MYSGREWYFSTSNVDSRPSAKVQNQMIIKKTLDKYVHIYSMFFMLFLVVHFTFILISAFGIILTLCNSPFSNRRQSPWFTASLSAGFPFLFFFSPVCISKVSVTPLVSTVILKIHRWVAPQVGTGCVWHCVPLVRQSKDTIFLGHLDPSLTPSSGLYLILPLEIPSWVYLWGKLQRILAS